jgi:hypothetical protein
VEQYSLSAAKIEVRESSCKHSRTCVDLHIKVKTDPRLSLFLSEETQRRGVPSVEAENTIVIQGDKFG